MSKGAVAEHTPRIHEFLIGRYGDRQAVADRKLVGLVQRDDGGDRWPIFGLIINNSPTGDLDGVDAGVPLTLRFRESNDRGETDFFFVHATGTLEFTANALDTETVTVDDGDIAVIFEFDNTGAVTAGNVRVPIGATAADSRNNLIQAINAVTQLKVEAAGDVISGNPGVLITHLVAGVGGNNALAETSAGITAVGMAGGAEANEVTVRRDAANVTTITVQPGGRAVFIMEAATKEFLRFDTDEENAQGQLVLSAWGVNLERWQRNASV